LLPVRFDRAGELKKPDLFPKAERRCHNCGSYAHTVQVVLSLLLSHIGPAQNSTHSTSHVPFWHNIACTARLVHIFGIK